MLRLPVLRQPAVKLLMRTRAWPTTARRQWYTTTDTPVIEADDNTFGNLVEQAEEPVLVDFYANWCGPCRTIAPILKRVAGQTGVRLVKLDVDESQTVAAKYQISALPTVALFKQGKRVDQFVGLKTAEAVRAFIDGHHQATVPPAS